MHQEPKFYHCGQCSQIVEVVCGDKVPCGPDGKPLERLEAHHQEGAAEKHLPVIECSGRDVVVKVGSVFHPMGEEHSIGWVVLVTEQGQQRVCLRTDGTPEARFALADGDQAVAAYAWCNLHGLWKTEI